METIIFDAWPLWAAIAVVSSQWGWTMHKVSSIDRRLSHIEKGRA